MKSLSKLLTFLLLLTPLTSFAIEGRVVYPDGHACNTDDECIPDHICCNGVCQQNPTCSTGGGGSSPGSSSSSPATIPPADNEPAPPADTPPETVNPDAANNDANVPFSDIVTHWSKDYVTKMNERRIVQGYPDGRFYPNVNVTRAELLKIAMGTFQIPQPDATEQKPFTDVAFGAWYTLYIAGAKKEGIINGYPDGTFWPNNNITRVEALKILIESAGINIQEAPTTFYDVLPGTWYEKYVGFARTEKIVEGYKDENGEPLNLFGPHYPITRGQACKIAMLLQEYEK